MSHDKSHDRHGKEVHRPYSSCISSVEKSNRNSIEFSLSNTDKGVVGLIPALELASLTQTRNIFEAIGKGDMFVQVPNGNKSKKIYVKDVLYTPNLSVTLLSVTHITQAGYTLHFK